jgi:hypothetical protein
VVDASKQAAGVDRRAPDAVTGGGGDPDRLLDAAPIVGNDRDPHAAKAITARSPVATNLADCMGRVIIAPSSKNNGGLARLATSLRRQRQAAKTVVRIVVIVVRPAADA